MKTRVIILFFIFSFAINGLRAQNLFLTSNDSIGGKPKNAIGIGGYVKLVATYDYLGLPNGSSFNMIEIPTVNDIENTSIDFNAWQSRFFIKNNFITNKNKLINAYIEGDFHGGNGGGFRMRFAYVNFENWTIGQTNSSFTNTDVWVNISDFDGPPVGVWVRQPQIKYTWDVNKNNQFNFSIENPVTDYRTKTILDTIITSTKSYVPDVVSNFRHKFKGGSFQVSGLFRLISYKSEQERQETFGYGFNFSGTLNVFKKDILYYQGVAGKGISRYLVGLSGYGLDAISIDKNLHTLPVYGSYVGYTHFWSNKTDSNLNLNSSFIYGYQEVKNEIYDGLSDIFSGNYYSANLFLTPIENISVGFEFVYGDKRDYLNQLGRNKRYYFTMEYSF